MKHLSQNLKYFATHLRFEALALAVLMVALTDNLDTPLWVLPVAFPFFDICILGYTISPKIGAFLYNLTHNATIPTLCVTAGVVFDIKWLTVLGFAWTFHTSVDRVLGFGLKHPESFWHTHLGKIGKSK